jgi:hypothetical protein
LRFFALFDDPVQAAHDPFSGKLVCHEIHRSGLIGSGRHDQRLRFIQFQPCLGLEPREQRQFTGGPADAFVLPTIALHVAQIEEAQAKALISLLGGQAFPPIRDRFTLVVGRGTLSIIRFTGLKRPTRQRNAEPSLWDGL